MAKLKQASIEATMSATIELSEIEAKALYEIFGYNVDEFLRVFYEGLGKSYLKPYEAGVRSLHDTIRAILNEPISKVDAAKEAIKPKKPSSDQAEKA